MEFSDGAILAQLGAPDMKVPILYAMSYPQRLPTGGKALDLFEAGQLTFQRPDPEKFPALRMAYEALAQGGAACCVLNAANETACYAFLDEKIPFGRISRIVEETLNRHGSLPAGSLEDVFRADALARETAGRLVDAI